MATDTSDIRIKAGSESILYTYQQFVANNQQIAIELDITSLPDGYNEVEITMKRNVLHNGFTLAKPSIDIKRG